MNLQYVFDYRSNQAAFYVSGDYAYSVRDNQATFYISGDYWYPYPASSTPAFYRNGKRTGGYFRKALPTSFVTGVTFVY